jgi:hypothetical protein
VIVQSVWQLSFGFPNVRITLRADSGFSAPTMYEVCEELDLDYTIGIGMASTLVTVHRFGSETVWTARWLSA